MKTIAIIVGAVLFAAPQAVTEKKYDPTEVQTLRLQVKQKDAQIAYLQWQEAQSHYTQALNDLNGECERIKTENKWPAELTCNQATLAFTMPPKPKPEEKKPEEKKP